MTEYKKGQRVKVEIEGEIEWALSDGRIRMPGCLDYIRTCDPAVKVTPADPKDWPPEPGDIWEADGEEYFARKSNLGGPVLAADSVDKGTLDPGRFLTLNPSLVRRRGR